MDKCSTDAEFDSYWDYEAKNKNRNRIRVGRQYQATVPPLLKPGEKDGRKCEDLETLKWKPGQISEQEIEQYLSMAKGIGLFAKSVNESKTQEKSDSALQSAFKGLSEFVASHHPCHHDDGCKVPKPSSSGESSSKINVTNDWSPSEAELFAQALEACGKNFGAIKKEYLPWKPVKSIIEYYYQGKGEKSPSHNVEDENVTQTLQVKPEGSSSPVKTEELLPQIKKDEEPIPSCSYEVKPSVSKIEVTDEASPVDPGIETLGKNDSSNFLENTRATDSCQDNVDMKVPIINNEEANNSSSTIGSLKFFLGGRLVLKLNAQQDSGSGTNKCQWVQSNDLPKHSNPKKVKHKKKIIQDFVSSPDTPQKKKRTEELTVTHKLPEYSLSAIRKTKLKSEYEFSESDKQGMLLCSSYWTPPVADGQESVDVDDASSKTSEGYVSPVLSNSRPNRGDVKNDHASNLSSVHELHEKNETDQSSLKFSSVQSENFAEDSASKNLCFIGGKNSPNQYSDDAFLKQEVLNHKSALNHNKFQVKSLCYQSRSSHSSSPLMKQWSKWSNMPYPEKSSPCSLSPVSVVDSKSPLKEIPLDLSSKENEASSACDESTIYKCTNSECHEKCMPSECESGTASSEFSPPSSSAGSHPQCMDSPKKDIKSNSFKCSNITSNDQQTLADALKKENYSSSRTSGDSSQIAYTYCNLPYPCASPKCTKEYTLEEHLCNKSNSESNQESCSGYTVHEIVDGVYKKNSDWCRSSCVPLPQCYAQCYPYYITYDVSPSPGSESSSTEMPLDLSSASENAKDKSTVPEKLPEETNDASKINSEDHEHGMLYQLLKNKTSK